MNQLVSLNDAQLPDHIRGGSSQAIGLVTSESRPRIALRDACFVLKKDGNEIKVPIGQPINVIILGIDPPEAKHTSKTYYEGAWVEGSTDAPDCSSGDGVTPDASIANPQCKACATCPKNAWGSGTNSDGTASAGKACSDRKNLFVTVAGKAAEGDIFTLSVPPTSLKALSAFGRELVRHDINMNKIITQIAVDPDNSKGMLFGYAGFLEQDLSDRVAARAAGPEVAEMAHQSLPAPAAEPQQVADAGAGELDLDALDTQPDVAAVAPKSDVAAVAPKSDVAAEKVANTQPTASGTTDKDGWAWDGRIHSAGKTLNADGTWRLKRGVAKELIDTVLAEQGGSPTEVGPEKVVGATTEVAADASSTADLDDLLGEWGSGV